MAIGFESAIRCIADKRSIRYDEFATITAWVFSDMSPDPEKIKFTTASPLGIGSPNWDAVKRIENSNAKQQITNRNQIMHSFTLKTVAVDEQI